MWRERMRAPFFLSAEWELSLHFLIDLTSAKSSKQLPAKGWGLLSSVISTVSSIKPRSFTVNSCISKMLLKIFSISWKRKKRKVKIWGWQFCLKSTKYNVSNIIVKSVFSPNYILIYSKTYIIKHSKSQSWIRKGNKKNLLDYTQ